MRYSDIIGFDPIESVVQLRDANAESDARRLVETYVISKRMSEVLTDLVIPQLQFLTPADNRGLLIVGNYGTGKSHLMAVISSVAERSELASILSNAAVAEKAPQIAGRFRVIRAEIGATTMSLRDIVVGALEDGLAELGVKYDFPPSSDRHENKSAFIEMMAAFQAAQPDRGLLLVIDELLDYLRSRADQPLILDLSFLRELGEICKGSRFRFIAGIQESLFDNPRFQFVAEPLRRVKDRFEQVRIVRDDVAYVVAQRLLKKDSKQQALVREHLTKFAPLYGSMNERIDEFVRLYPVHPSYLDTFERVYVAEKREILKTLSATIRGIIDHQIPEHDTGLISYDSYWPHLRDNPSFRSIPEIREVIEKSTVLESRIEHAFTRPQYRPAALRIVHGLSVHRLTTGDIYAPLGATAEELRDDLALMLPVPERDAGFLRTVVESVMKEIARTVSGQFLSFNPENGQYFIDLKKDVDFDSLIEKKAESLDGGQLDRGYFDAMVQLVLDDPTLPPHVPGYRIWDDWVEWRERRAGRDGYLFFGTPAERSTAQPPRDFYLYFIQPFDPPFYKDEKKDDEVFFQWKERDPQFEAALRRFAAARELAASASSGNRKTYEDKAAEHLRAMTEWLRKNMPHGVEVTYQGRSKSLIEVVRGKLPPSPSIRDYIGTAGSVLLEPRFQDKAPDYPTFSVLVTRNNREQTAQEALRWIAGGVRSKQGTAILDALELLQGDTLKPRESRYAKQVLELLAQKGHGQVLNRSELVQSDAGVEYWIPFRIEPEFLAVVAAALVHSGDVVMSVVGKRLDAANIDQFSKLGIQEVRDFKHVERPKDLPLGALQELCDLLGVPAGLMVNPANRDEAVMQIQQAVSSLLVHLANALSVLPELVFWGKPVLSQQEQTDWRHRLSSLKTFLESLQPFNTTGKLKNFPHDAAAVQGQKPAIALLRELEEMSEVLQHTAPLTAYLGKGEALLGAAHPWQEAARTVRDALLAKVNQSSERAKPSFRTSLEQELASLKTSYADAYAASHQRSRLGPADDKKKGLLAKDPRLVQLQKLASVEMMPAQQLRELENELHSLRTCIAFSKADLESDPLCPHCGFRPAEEAVAGSSAGQRLRDVEERLDALLQAWTQTLRSNLADPTVSGNVDLISDKKGKDSVRDFIDSATLPEALDQHLVKALQEVLSGLQKVTVTSDQIRGALSEGGMPATVPDLRERFERLLGGLIKGKDASKVRVVLE